MFSRQTLSFFFHSTLGWISGIAIGILCRWSGIYILIFGAGVLFFWCIKNYWKYSIALICLFGGWYWSMNTLASLSTQQKILGESVGWNGYTHTVTGTVKNLISVNEYGKRYSFLGESIDGKPAMFSVALSIPANLNLTSGDTVTSTGKFYFPKDTNEYAGEKSLWYRGLLAEFQSFQNKKIEPKKRSLIIQTQTWLDTQLKTIFPNPGYAILAGIIFGQRTQFDDELREHLKASGLMHIMVVSGGNIMMLIVFLSLFIRGLPVLIRIGIVVSVICSFCLIVGGDMPVWRAALMGTIGYTASLWGYRFPGLILPIGVAVLISVWNPLALMYDIGLQLSFLSVICIIVWGKTLVKKLSFLGNFFAEASALTIAATLGTFPITLFYFGTFSLIGPLANMFAAPAIPILMYGGLATIGAHILSPVLSYWIGYIPWIATNYLMQVVSFFGSQQWSLITVDITQYKISFIVISLGTLLLFIVRNQKNLLQ